MTHELTDDVRPTLPFSTVERALLEVPPASEHTLSITVCDNGWLLRYGPRIEVVEQGEEYLDTSAVEARDTQRLLWRVVDLLGRGGSKHDRYRCRVVVFDQESGEEVEPE